MMADKDQLLELERNFWTGDSAFFELHVDGDCLIAFSPEMAGVMNRSDLAATAKDGNLWKDLEITLKGFIEPTDGIAMLTYEARAVRENGEPYAALVSTGYARRDDGWRMIFHQQTPVARTG
jgi:hypothetical protein